MGPLACLIPSLKAIYLTSIKNNRNFQWVLGHSYALTLMMVLPKINSLFNDPHSTPPGLVLKDRLTYLQISLAKSWVLVEKLQKNKKLWWLRAAKL